MNTERIIVIGTSCSGKTTLAKQLKDIYNVKHIELDYLYWKPNWKESTSKEFKQKIMQEVNTSSWIIDGNYSDAKESLWPLATTIIWLNYPFSLVIYRAVRRSWKRAFRKEKLFAGNVESFKQSFFSKDSIILWVMKTYYKRKQEYSKMLYGLEMPKTIKIVELRSQKATNIYLSKLKKTVK